VLEILKDLYFSRFTKGKKTWIERGDRFVSYAQIDLPFFRCTALNFFSLASVFTCSPVRFQSRLISLFLLNTPW